MERVYRQVSGRPNKCSRLSQKTAEELEAQLFESEMNPRDIESTLHIASWAAREVVTYLKLETAPDGTNSCPNSTAK